MNFEEEIYDWKDYGDLNGAFYNLNGGICGNSLLGLYFWAPYKRTYERGRAYDGGTFGEKHWRIKRGKIRSFGGGKPRIHFSSIFWHLLPR
jgi:hypothetical protein